MTLRDVDAIAVTEGPGLIGSLLVGLVYGKALALVPEQAPGGCKSPGRAHPRGACWKIKWTAPPASLFRKRESPPSRWWFPGATPLCFYVAPSSPGTSQPCPPFNYTQLGHSRDDAAGEAFDKVARLLALGYPGGPVIDKLSRFGNPRAVDFGHIKMKGNPLDFSFSGLKTAVLYRVRGTELATRGGGASRLAQDGGAAHRLTTFARHCSQATLDLIASFQHAVVQDLVERTLAAAEDSRVDNIFVSGGVACNSLLRQRFTEWCRGSRFSSLPPRSPPTTPP